MESKQKETVLPLGSHDYIVLFIKSYHLFPFQLTLLIYQGSIIMSKHISCHHIKKFRLRSFRLKDVPTRLFRDIQLDILDNALSLV